MQEKLALIYYSKYPKMAIRLVVQNFEVEPVGDNSMRCKSINMRDAIQKSLPLGVKDCVGYSITVAEHLNELSPLVELTEEEVEKALQ